MAINYTSLRPILDVLSEYGELSPKQISEKTGLWKTITQAYLKELVTRGEIEKVGAPPKTRYKIYWKQDNPWVVYVPILGFAWDNPFDYQTRKILDENFTKFSSTGTRYQWLDGFYKWVNKREENIDTMVNNFLKVQQKIVDIQDTCGIIDATDYFWKQFDEVYLDAVYYADLYIWLEFGRWRLAEITFYAKQSQNTKLINESIDEIFPKLECLIAREKPDAIVITPWSIDRRNQLLKILGNSLKVFNIPSIRLTKYSPSGILIPQKSLKTSKEREENAKNTIFVDDVGVSEYKKVLLIDDFVWSGATLNETAKKLKDAWVGEVIGFTFVGNLNLNEYEIIREI